MQVTFSFIYHIDWIFLLEPMCLCLLKQTVCVALYLSCLSTGKLHFYVQVEPCGTEGQTSLWDGCLCGTEGQVSLVSGGHSHSDGLRHLSVGILPQFPLQRACFWYNQSKDTRWAAAFVTTNWVAQLLSTIYLIYTVSVSEAKSNGCIFSLSLSSRKMASMTILYYRTDSYWLNVFFV